MKIEEAFIRLRDDLKEWVTNNLNAIGRTSVHKIYPVGSIYMSVNNVDPSLLFEGTTWEQIKDKFLLSAGDTYKAGATGGEATHKLTVDEMPQHQHGYSSYQDGYPSTFSDSSNYRTPVVRIGTSNVGSGVTNTQSTFTGGSQAHNNMPPYLTVYVWKRTS